MSTESVRRSLTRFIEAVLKRLSDLDLPGTLLAQEWTAVKEAEGDPDLRAFCIAAARLGSTLSRLTSVGGGQVEDLAEEFGVSERVIEHQIQNHRLARLILD